MTNERFDPNLSTMPDLVPILFSITYSRQLEMRSVERITPAHRATAPRAARSGRGCTDGDEGADSGRPLLASPAVRQPEPHRVARPAVGKHPHPRTGVEFGLPAQHPSEEVERDRRVGGTQHDAFLFVDVYVLPADAERLTAFSLAATPCAKRPAPPPGPRAPNAPGLNSSTPFGRGWISYLPRSCTFAFVQRATALDNQ